MGKEEETMTYCPLIMHLRQHWTPPGGDEHYTKTGKRQRRSTGSAGDGVTMHPLWTSSE